VGLPKGVPAKGVVRSAFLEIAQRFSDDPPTVNLPVLRRRYAAFPAWPADARLGLYVLAWVLGPGFHIRPFSKAVNQLHPDFAAAAGAIGKGSTPTTIAITGVVRQLFRNASVVVARDLNPSLLYWPIDLSTCK